MLFKSDLNWFNTFLVQFNGITIYDIQKPDATVFLEVLLKCLDHGGRVVTLSPPTSEAGVRFPAWPQVGKLVVTCRWSAVYSPQP